MYRLRLFLNLLHLFNEFFLYLFKIEMAANGSLGGESLFKSEEIMEICELEFGDYFVEMRCGCTSKKYGDTTGKLKIFESGDLEIECDCGCREGKLTPSEFETHAIGEGVPKRWKQKIWVQVKGKKVPIKNTALLKYYNKAEEASGSIRGARARRIHRDEFKYCVKCSKARRFRLQTKEECRVYHDVERNTDWKCSDFPDGRSLYGKHEVVSWNCFSRNRRKHMEHVLSLNMR